MRKESFNKLRLVLLFMSLTYCESHNKFLGSAFGIPGSYLGFLKFEYRRGVWPSWLWSFLVLLRPSNQFSDTTSNYALHKFNFFYFLKVYSWPAHRIHTHTHTTHTHTHTHKHTHTHITRAATFTKILLRQTAIFYLIILIIYFFRWHNM